MDYILMCLSRVGTRGLQVVDSGLAIEQRFRDRTRVTTATTIFAAILP
jgi:hypothetical protein